MLNKQLSLSELINELPVGKIAKAHFADENWYVTRRTDQAIVYCSEEGWFIDGLIPLTNSNLHAKYEIL